MAGSWLGCNLLLGNEPATFSPQREAGEDGPDIEPDASVADAGCTRTDLATNPQHCGACDHDCLGGACFLGKCQPVVIAINTTKPRAFIVDETHVYWTDTINTTAQERLQRAPIFSDAGTEVLYVNGALSWGDSFTVSSSEVVFGDDKIDGGIYGCAKTGCADGGPRTLYGRVNNPRDVHLLSSGELTWTEAAADGGIDRCTYPCTSPFTRLVVNEGVPENLAVTPAALFWTKDLPPGVWTKANADASVVQLGDAGVVGQLAAVHERVFVATGTGSGLLAIPTNGAAAVVYGAEVSPVVAVATDGKDVYFAEGVPNGRILRCPVGDCSAGPVEIAKAISVPDSVFVDAKSVYWFGGQTATGSYIMRVAK